MRISHVILLVEIVVLAQANHECDSFAVNVSEAKTKRQGADAKNKSLSLKQYLQMKTGTFYSTHGTPRIGANNASFSKFCTALGHGENCGGFKFTRRLNDGFEGIRKTLFKGVSFETVLIGYNWKDNLAIEYRMTLIGKDEDDYIFQWLDGTEITAHQLVGNDPNRKVQLEIPNDIENILKSEFALYSYKIDNYYVYVTCDGTAAWVTYHHGVAAPIHDDDDLIADLDSLVDLVKAEKKDITLGVHRINRRFPHALTEYLPTIFPQPTATASTSQPKQPTCVIS